MVLITVVETFHTVTMIIENGNWNSPSRNGVPDQHPLDVLMYLLTVKINRVVDCVIV